MNGYKIGGPGGEACKRAAMRDVGPDAKRHRSAASKYNYADNLDVRLQRADAETIDESGALRRLRRLQRLWQEVKARVHDPPEEKDKTPKGKGKPASDRHRLSHMAKQDKLQKFRKLEAKWSRAHWP